MKKSILLALSLGLLTPLIQAAETKKPAASETDKAKPKDDETRLAAAREQAGSLSAEQNSKLLALVNKGEAKSIEEIKGIGPKRSANIIAKRPYAKVEDLSKVVGEKTFSEIITFAQGKQAPKKEATSKKAE